jgi:hypothetical protein
MTRSQYKAAAHAHRAALRELRHIPGDTQIARAFHRQCYRPVPQHPFRHAPWPLLTWFAQQASRRSNIERLIRERARVRRRYGADHFLATYANSELRRALNSYRTSIRQTNLEKAA